jgi:hypothetical protein
MNEIRCAFDADQIPQANPRLLTIGTSLLNCLYHRFAALLAFGSYPIEVDIDLLDIATEQGHAATDGFRSRLQRCQIANCVHAPPQDRPKAIPIDAPSSVA